MPELCKLLTNATGITHTADANLNDYPIFVSVKSGDSARIRKLVAYAMHGQWVEDNGRLRLKAVKPKPDEDYPEFERMYREACKKDSKPLQLPIHDLYAMSPGEAVRYGAVGNSYVRQLPPDLLKLADSPDAWWIVRRMSAGVFEFAEGQQIDFESLPKEVVDLVGDDIKKQPLTPEELAQVR